jgi:hypothetical protein
MRGVVLSSVLGVHTVSLSRFLPVPVPVVATQLGSPHMSTGLDVFDTTQQQTNLWLKDLMQELGIDRHHAYKVLSATLHAVRDRIGPEHAAAADAYPRVLLRVRRRGSDTRMSSWITSTVKFSGASASIPIVRFAPFSGS